MTIRSTPRARASIRMWEGLGGQPRSAELLNENIAGSVTQLQDYKIEVLRVIWGKDTKLDTNHKLVTRGNEPAASVLVRVTRTKRD